MPDSLSLACRPCVLLDFDGTLAGTAPLIAAAARRALLDLGYDDA